MLHVAEMRQQIAAQIKAWDGEDLNKILPAVQHLQALQTRARNYENVSDKDRSALDEIASKDDEAYHALIEAGERSDLDWPSPWNEWACEFAWVVDRQGQYLTRDVFGVWYIDKWRPGENCMFDVKLDHWT